MIKNVPDSTHSAQKVFNLDQIKKYLYGSRKLYKIDYINICWQRIINCF